MQIHLYWLFLLENPSLSVTWMVALAHTKTAKQQNISYTHITTHFRHQYIHDGKFGSYPKHTSCSGRSRPWPYLPCWLFSLLSFCVNHKTEFNTESEPFDRIELSERKQKQVKHGGLSCSRALFFLCACAKLTPQVISIAISLDC